MALIGMGGMVVDGTQSYAVETWSVNLTNDVQDVTDTSSGGWTARIQGVSSAEISLTMFYNQASPQIPGTRLFAGNLFVFTANIATTLKVISGAFIVSSVSVENPAKSPVKVSVTGQSTGTITIT